MQLDSLTLLIAASTLLVVLGVVLAYFWNRDRRSAWLLWWGLSFVVLGISAFGYTHPNWDNEFLNICFGNAVRIGCLGMLWHGIRTFHRKPPLASVTLVMVSIWMGLCLVPEFLASMEARIVVVSAMQAISSALAAMELWRGRAEPLPSRTPAIVAFLSYAALMLVRVAGVNILPLPLGAGPLDPLWMGGFTLALFGHAMFLGFLILALTKERLELEQRNIALVDPLTGLLNRRAFMAHVERSARRRIDRPEPISLLVLDLDGFKSINDRHGHEMGDKVLAAFAALAEANTRPSDHLYRLGGEEFCFILPDTRQSDAILVAERVRRALASTAVEDGDGERILATVSVGIASADFAGFDLELLVAAADAALYEAKARGRNRVIVADPSALSGRTQSGRPELRRLSA